MKVWVLTSEHNDYDQYGEYFLAVYKEKPSLKECESILLKHGIIDKFQAEEHKTKMAKHLQNGGGRIDSENMWLYLYEEQCK